MIITKDIVDLLAPAHCRTSCDDGKLNNAWNDENHQPRCLRCYYLSNIGKDSQVLPWQIAGILLELRIEEEKQS